MLAEATWRAAFFAGVFVAGFVAVALTLGGADLQPFAIVGLFYGGTIITLSGIALLAWIADDQSSPNLPLAILLGSIVTSLSLLAACLLMRKQASTAFLWWSALVLLVTSWKHKHILKTTLAANRQEFLSLVLIGSSVLFWCRPVATLLPTLETTGIAAVWSDYFVHGTDIAQFSGSLAGGESAFLLAGEPIGFYHYAPLMLPAAVAGLVDLPAAAIAASVLFPYGILLASLGVYSLGSAIASPTVGLLASLALLFFPDASTYGLQNGYFSFHWLLCAAPGSGYGLGVAFAALTLFAHWKTSKRAAFFWLALMLTIGLFQFRANIFLVFAPAVLMTLVSETDFARHHRRRFWTALISGIAAALLVVLMLTSQDLVPEFSTFRPFLEYVHTGQTPTSYDGLYHSIQERYGTFAAIAWGFVALIPLVLGASVLIFPLATTLAIRRTGWRTLDSFPLWCIACWLGLVLVAPTAMNGDLTSYQHRGFVLVYASTFVWCFAQIVRALRGMAFPRSGVNVALWAVVVLALGTGLVTWWNKNPGEPRFAWGEAFFGARFEQGLLASAAFVHHMAEPGDTFALIPADPSARVDDTATRFASLANVPTYLARPAFQMFRGPSYQSIVEHRVAVLKALEVIQDPDAAFDLLRSMQVTFLVALGETGPAFDPNRSGAIFSVDNVTVYRVPTAMVAIR